jgi:hypothetical protein
VLVSGLRAAINELPSNHLWCNTLFGGEHTWTASEMQRNDNTFNALVQLANFDHVHNFFIGHEKEYQISLPIKQFWARFKSKHNRIPSPHQAKETTVRAFPLWKRKKMGYFIWLKCFGTYELGHRICILTTSGTEWSSVGVPHSYVLRCHLP